MKSVIAHRCSGFSASANDGIGVPFNPVLIARKISSRDDPPRNVQLWVRSAARIEWPQSSVRVGADGPSPRPSVPWHFAQPFSSNSFFPSATVSFVVFGALGSETGSAAFWALAKSGEKVVMKYARSDNSASERLGQAGIDV